MTNNAVQARLPEDIPRLFAEAWNRRDANAIAVLFEPDASFVNVVGLWWRSREDIQKAHAYGLETIFNRSTLTIRKVVSKSLGDGTAVVNARMKLDGQSAIGAVAQPGARFNIFTFVTVRRDAGWLCAAAHNTDVVPGMETHVMEPDGSLRAADYRKGPAQPPQ